MLMYVRTAGLGFPYQNYHLRSIAKDTYIQCGEIDCKFPHIHWFLPVILQ